MRRLNSLYLIPLLAVLALLAVPVDSQPQRDLVLARNHAEVMRVIDGSLERRSLMDLGRRGDLGPADTFFVIQAETDAYVRSVAADSLDAVLERIEREVAALRDRAEGAEAEASRQRALAASMQAERDAAVSSKNAAVVAAREEGFRAGQAAERAGLLDRIRDWFDRVF